MELLARPHIDHIFPLALGGSNDLVNLQLLCETCNLKKSASWGEIKPSVPRYQGDYILGQTYEDGLP